MALVTVPAIKAFDWQDRRVQVGEIMTVPAVVAAVMHRRGLVSLTKVATPLVTPAPTPEIPPIRSRQRRASAAPRHRRKDLRADP